MIIQIDVLIASYTHIADPCSSVLFICSYSVAAIQCSSNIHSWSTGLLLLLLLLALYSDQH